MAERTSNSPTQPSPGLPTPTGDGTVAVWDLLVRVTHWSLALLFVITYLTEDWQALHQGAGYAILGLVGVRVVWGFVGSTHARFRDFVGSPSAAIAYVRGLADGTAPRSLGHNAAGGWMTLALLMSLVASGITGWSLTRQPGEPAEWLKDLHETAANVTLALVVLHLFGVMASSLRHNENLVNAMIFGRKSRTVEQPTRDKTTGNG